jgi:hypothetical protein
MTTRAEERDEVVERREYAGAQYFYDVIFIAVEKGWK